MADSTLNDVISSLRDGTGDKQTQALLERVAASNASIVERLDRSETETKRRFQEQQEASAEAAKDALNAKNEEALAAKNAKKQPAGGRIGGFIKDQRDAVSKRGGGDFGLGLGLGLARFAGIGAALAAIGALTLDDGNIKNAGSNFAKMGQVLGTLGGQITGLFDMLGLKIPSLTELMTKGNDLVSNSLDGLIALQEGNYKEFLKSSDDLAITSAIGINTAKQLAKTDTISGRTAKGVGKVVDGTKSIVGLGIDKAKPMIGDMGRFAASTGVGKKVLDLGETAAIKGMIVTDKVKDVGRGIKDGAKGLVSGLGKDLMAGPGGHSATPKPPKPPGLLKQGLSLTGKASGWALSKSAAGFLGVLKGIAKRVPIVSSLLAGGSIISTLMDESLSKSEKSAAIFKLLMGLGGGALGAIAGAAAGSIVPGLGTIIGGIGGGLAGTFFGEQIAQMLTDFVMDDGKQPKIPSELKEMNKVVSTSGQMARGQRGGSGSEVIDQTVPRVAGRMGRAQQLRAARQTTGEDIASGQAQYAAASGAGSPPMVVSDTSQKITNVGGATAYQSGNGLTSGDPIPSGTS